ncbi:hypothetical protein RDI58_001546 [Solanum bulbocastanum]|uniref:Uncharacterized protein n=1 Tax=Solanum bulbocastanum TaxID=147425 RepID=A0AAN8YTD9_SOLBU
MQDATGSEVGKTIHGTKAEVQILGNQVLKKVAGNKKILEDNIQGNEVVTWGQQSPEIMKDGALSSKEIASSSARQMHRKQGRHTISKPTDLETEVAEKSANLIDASPENSAQQF